LALVIRSYPNVINLPRIEAEPINVSIRTDVSPSPNSGLDLFFDQGERLKRQEKWFKELERELLHNPKEKLTNRLKDATKYETEIVHIWDTQIERGSMIWQKDKGIWKQRLKLQKSEVFWDRNRDGLHVEPAQVWYTNDNEKRIIPSREILDDNYGKNKKRNDTIEKIRDKYLRRYKTQRGNYENLGNYYYKSEHDKELFLKEVEELGLVRKAKRKKSTVEVSPLEYYRRYMSNRYQENEL
jgi:hypothetical protein